MGIAPVAHAQSSGYGMCGTNATWQTGQIPAGCDQGIAFSECKAKEDEAASSLEQRYGMPGKADKLGCPAVGQNPTYFRCYARIPGIGDTECGKYYFGERCSARPYELGWQGGGTAATVNVCHKGCMYSSSLDAEATSGIGYSPTGGTCTESDAPEPKPVGDGGGDDGGGTGGGTGGETGGGDGDGGSDGGGDGGGDGGSGGGDGGGDGEGDGDGDGDGDGGPGDGGENPSLPGDPQYPGDVPMPYMDPPIPSSYLGQWSSGLGNGSCPATKVVTVALGGISTSVNFEFKPLCDFALMIRGLVIACAGIAAAYIVAGVRK